MTLKLRYKVKRIQTCKGGKEEHSKQRGKPVQRPWAKKDKYIIEELNKKPGCSMIGWGEKVIWYVIGERKEPDQWTCVVAKTLHCFICALKYCWKRLEWLKL